MYRQLLDGDAPIMQWIGPLFLDALSCQIDQFQQRILRSESTLGLGYFSDLTMISFDRICCVDNLSDGFGVCLLYTSDAADE